MYVTLPPTIEQRLQKRYRQLVAQHTGQAQATAPGLRILPEAASTWAATMAAWRFFHNPRLTPKILAQPLLDAGRQAVPVACDDYVLAVHDWSNLDFRSHTSKHDRMVLGQAEEIGYELHTCLLVSDTAGEPLAPVYQGVQSAAGLTSSRSLHTNPWPADRSNLDALVDTMNYVRRLQLGRTAVHVIDAEADSVAHFRAWAKAGHLFVVRVKDSRVVRHAGQQRKLHEVVRQLQHRFAFTRPVQYHEQPAQQFVAETEVVLYRPAKPWRKNQAGQRVTVKGPALTLRLVVSQVRDAAGQLLAEWLLLTNVPVSVLAAQVALWYYWRWRIESYFKLLKSAGQQVEHWQQETAAVLTRRLLVAGMACVLVWQIARQPGADGASLRALLMRLSGRAVKRSQPWTLPGLLAGLWVLLALVAVSEEYTLDHLRQVAQSILGKNVAANPTKRQQTTHGSSP
jgi:hypothetical protein